MLLTAKQFIGAARHDGFDFFTGVPCSFLTPLINGVLNDATLRYVGAASEGEAVAIAAGAWAAGRRPVVMCQNSGLGNAVNPLTSLNAPFRIPTLLITTWRGEPGRPDEPQHLVMGEITHELLALIGVEHAVFPASAAALPAAVSLAAARLAARSLPYALVMCEGSVAPEPLAPPAAAAARLAGRRYDDASAGALPSRLEILETFLALTDEAAGVIATTGKCGRELFTLSDRRQHLYQVGSMGGASAMGLGVALNTKRKIVVLDGDGAALMKLGNFATIGAYRPENLLHIVLDNGVHDSTGGQATVSATVDFAGVALACGYGFAATCRTVAGFAASFARASGAAGPSLIHARIAPGSLEKLGRPSVGPDVVARRFKAFLMEDPA